MINHKSMEECGYKGEHHCWVAQCKCGWINWGCVRWQVKCKACGKYIEFEDYGLLYQAKYSPSLEVLKGMEDYQI